MSITMTIAPITSDLGSNSGPNVSQAPATGTDRVRCFRRRHLISANAPFIQPTSSGSSPPNHHNQTGINTNLVKTSSVALASSCGAKQLNARSVASPITNEQPAGGINATGPSAVSQTSAHSSTITATSTGSNTQATARDATRSFIDCLVRRFKDCFSENSVCSVPVFVVGNLSPGSDGTHLILPPCVSLVGQNISRYARPSARYANIRLLNSLRDSCRNIEELDLGTNKLTELVEIYKILQVTPNLRFLNISENDLSRATPMALATTTYHTNNNNQHLSVSHRLNSSYSAHQMAPSSSSSILSAVSAQHTQQQQQQHQRLTQRAVSNMGPSSGRIGTNRTNTIGSSTQSPTKVGPQLTGGSGKPTTGVKERRAARAVALSRSVSSLSSVDAKDLASNARNQRQQHQKQNHQQTSSARATGIAMTRRRIATQSHHDSDGDVVMSSTGTTGHSSTINSSVHSRRTFESIRVLAMNNTRVPWPVVCSMLSRMPNVEELHLSLNNYKSIDLDPKEFRHSTLRRLYLSGNPELSDWTELDKLLAVFPSLEALSIADCNISNIPDNFARQWHQLCGLNIGGWPIKEWPIIERLNQLASLVDLKCQNVQLLNDIDEPRHHLIARLPKLVRLNGSEIEEREHAEKAFVRFFLQNQHLERPTRFHELIQVHGEVSPILDVDLSPPDTARIKVVYYRNKGDDEMLTPDRMPWLMDSSDNSSPNTSANEADDENEMSDQQHTVVPMTIDLRKTVRSFKIELSEMFGLNPAKMIVYYIDHEMVGLMGPEVLKHNQKKLWNYHVQDGDQFVVDEK